MYDKAPRGEETAGGNRQKTRTRIRLLQGGRSLSQPSARGSEETKNGIEHAMCIGRKIERKLYATGAESTGPSAWVQASKTLLLVTSGHPRDTRLARPLQKLRATLPNKVAPS